MEAYVLESIRCILIKSPFQIPLEDSAVDAGKSAIVYNLTRAVSNPSSAVSCFPPIPEAYSESN